MFRFTLIKFETVVFTDYFLLTSMITAKCSISVKNDSNYSFVLILHNCMLICYSQMWKFQVIITGKILPLLEISIIVFN